MTHPQESVIIQLLDRSKRNSQTTVAWGKWVFWIQSPPWYHKPAETIRITNKQESTKQESVWYFPMTGPA